MEASRGTSPRALLQLRDGGGVLLLVGGVFARPCGLVFIGGVLALSCILISSGLLPGFGETGAVADSQSCGRRLVVLSADDGGVFVLASGPGCGDLLEAPSACLLEDLPGMQATGAFARGSGRGCGDLLEGLLRGGCAMQFCPEPPARLAPCNTFGSHCKSRPKALSTP